MKALKILSKSVVLLILSLVILEFASRALLESVLKRSRTFQLDEHVGWRIRPERPTQHHESDVSKSLILGDSFVFGEEVTLEDRFDNQMLKMGYPGPIVNMGVSGYSTDQEFIAATNELGGLRSADTVVLVTFGDDLKGLVSDFFAGRHKPKFEMGTEKLVLIKPQIDWTAQLIDRSYLAAAVHKIFRPKRTSHKILDRKKFEEALKLYEALIVQYLAPQTEQKVNVILVFHGKKIIDIDFGSGAGEEFERFLQEISQKYKFLYLPLDGEMDRSEYRQPKGVHWNAAGHRRFAQILRAACDKSIYRLHLSPQEKT